ncbi:MAG: metal ABC transporter permease [Candidatus Hydrogenedentota bacterium]
MSPEVVIMLVGSFVATGCAMVGCFLVLRKMALLGDAISHAVLPGIVLAFLFTNSRAALPMVVGAGCLGVLTVFLVSVLNNTRRLREDAAIGVVFPALFSIGVILISRYAAQVDLDLDCVLYGEIAYTPWDTLTLWNHDLGPRALWVTGTTMLLIAFVVALLYKELKITSFDPELAASLGFSPVLMHYVLMTSVSVVVVSSFEAVGAILVVAMLIVPPATAYLFTTRLSAMLLLSIGIGIFSAVAGYEVAHNWNCSIAGAMAAVAGFCFLLALLFSPQGLVARALRHRRLALRLAGQLLMLHLKEDAAPQPAYDLAHRFGWSRLRLARVVAPLEYADLVEVTDSGYRLTRAGLKNLESIGTQSLAH